MFFDNLLTDQTHLIRCEITFSLNPQFLRMFSYNSFNNFDVFTVFGKMFISCFRHVNTTSLSTKCPSEALSGSIENHSAGSVQLLFSGLFPLGRNPASFAEYQFAANFGAAITGLDHIHIKHMLF